jgi:hypothetical protein
MANSQLSIQDLVAHEINRYLCYFRREMTVEITYKCMCDLPLPAFRPGFDFEAHDLFVQAVDADAPWITLMFPNILLLHAKGG